MIIMSFKKTLRKIFRISKNTRREIAQTAVDIAIDRLINRDKEKEEKTLDTTNLTKMSQEQLDDIYKEMSDFINRQNNK